MTINAHQAGQTFLENVAKPIAKQISSVPTHLGFLTGRVFGAVVAAPGLLIASAIKKCKGQQTEFSKSLNDFSIDIASVGAYACFYLARASAMPGLIVGRIAALVAGAVGGAAIIGAQKLHAKLTGAPQVEHKSIRDYATKTADACETALGIVANAGLIALCPIILGPVIGSSLLFFLADSLWKKELPESEAT